MTTILDFALQSDRDPGLWPFLSTSPWNRPIGANAVFAKITSGLGGGFPAGALHYSKWTTPVWFASLSDPMRTITDAKDPPFQRRVPDAAVQSPDSDGNCIVVAPDHLTAVEMYRFTRLADGNISCQNAKEVDLKGDGLRGTITCGISMGGGNIRAGELRDGIRHVLNFTTGAKLWNRFAPGGKGAVWPARWPDRYFDQPEPDGYGSSGNLFMGSWVALPPDVIAGLGLVTPEGLVVARALRDYGAIGAVTSKLEKRFIVRFDYAAFLSGDLAGVDLVALKDDLGKIAVKLQVISNSHDGGAVPVWYATADQGVGGGAPRVPFAPGFA